MHIALSPVLGTQWALCLPKVAVSITILETDSDATGYTGGKPLPKS